jgi:exodeoxyribonuclease III
MKLATWNVNSVTARLPLIQQWLDSARPDVLCLQETKCVDEKFPRQALAELGYAAETLGQPTYNGVAIISRLPSGDVRRGFSESRFDAQARMITATVGGVRVVNVYVPNGGFVGSDKYGFKLEWMRRLRQYFDAEYEKGEQVLLCGDFNVAPDDDDVHDPDLWRGKILFSEPERRALGEIKAWGLTDAFRLHNPDVKQYSWWDYRAGSFRRNLGLRIDHIYVSQPLAERLAASWIDKEPRKWERPSDHTPVVAEFNLGDR